MTFKALHFTSASGTADGKGVVSFGPEPTLTNTRLNLSKVPWQLSSHSCLNR